MRIGLICVTTSQGLGTLSWEFYRHLKPEKVLLVNNGVFQTFPERYEGTPSRKYEQHSQEDIDWFLEGLDAVMSFETFYDWSIIKSARRKGVKTILVTMAELFPEKVPITPDLFLCPSKLDMQIVPEPKAFLPVPLATDRLIWHKRTKANVFIHTASHGGMGGRKGTALLLEAMKYVKSDIKLKIFSWKDIPNSDPRVEVCKINFKNYWQLYRDQGDVLVYPQGANGICLPIVEAMASGMAVITTDFFPFNEYMPKELLFKPMASFKRRMAPMLREVDDYKISPESIAEKIDFIAGKDITKYSEYGKKFAEENSWKKLLPKYIKTLEKLCE